MRKALLVGISIIFLSGCATNMPKEVDIPVESQQSNDIKIPPKPALPIAKLKKTSKPNEVIKAYAASVVLLEGYSDQLIKILNSYE
jgi:hypothetical protein